MKLNQNPTQNHLPNTLPPTLPLSVTNLNDGVNRFPIQAFFHELPPHNSD